MRRLNKVLELGATACSAEACVALLSGASALAKAFADRKHLFDRILNQAVSEKGARAKALRCLLHGTPEQWGHVEDDLFEAASGNIDPLFAGLIRQALQQLNQLWRMIPESIASQLALTDAQRQDLRLVQPLAPKAQALLRLVGPDKIDCAHLTLPECDVLQQQFDDVEVLRALNIFETIEGARVRITHSSYVDSGFTELPPKFSGLVTLLKRKPRYLLPIHGVVLAHELGWEAVIEIAFAQQNPADHWESIMLALSKGTPRKDLHEPILKTSWLPPAAQGAPPVAPGDLLHVEGLDDELEKLLVALQSPFRPLAAVKKEARTHAGFATLSRTVLPRPGECVRQLAATILQQDSDVKYSSGLVGDWSAENVSDWLLVFSEVAADTLPLASVVKALAGKPAAAEYLPEFLQVTGRELTTAKCALVLDFLSAQHKLATQEKKAFFERVTIRYLRQHAQNGTQRLLELLKRQSVKLLNASGQWKSPSELTFVTSNIHPGDRLSDSFAAALESLKPSRPEIRELAGASLRGGASETDTQVACILKQYFMPWRSLLLNRDPIGAFVCLTGDGPAVLTLAREFFTTSSVDSVRAWINQNDRSDLGTIEERIWRRRFEITTIKEDHAEVGSVIGTTFRARLSSRPASLFIGTEDDGIEVIQDHGVTVLRLRLRELQFEREEFGADELVELLRASTDHLLRALRARVDVGPLFQKLSIASQLHVRVAQNMVIEGAIAFLRQIGAQRHPPIKEALAKWDEARRHEAEDEVHGLNSSRSAKERREARDALRKLLATDEEAQRAVLEAVRRKISEFQYAETSVPFELWQNADDAVVELDRLGGAERQAASLGFVVREFDGTLLFLHWGRPINEFQSTTGADYRGVGFDRDLEKMLVPAMSDKADAVQAGGHALTGKFGLGFKSVFLMSDKPRVLSGALDFQVCGGIYPIPLDESARQDLQEQLKRTAPASFRRGTVICLPVRKDAKVDPPHCLSPFLRLAPLLVVFSRRIKRLRLNLGTAPEQSFTWNPNSILPDGCDFGSIAGPLESPRSALVLTARDRCRSAKLTHLCSDRMIHPGSAKATVDRRASSCLGLSRRTRSPAAPSNANLQPPAPCSRQHRRVAVA
jgi:hypothetical protein